MMKNNSAAFPQFCGSRFGGFAAITPYLVVMVALIMLLPSCRRGYSSDTVPDCEITRPLDSLLSTVFSDPRDPGAVVMVMRDGKIVYDRCYGRARLDKDTPLTDTTMLNVAAATKTFVTTGLLKLVEQGRVSLDDSLTRFFPTFPKAIFDKITLRHVLTLSTGLPDPRPRTKSQWDEYVLENPATPFDDALDYMLYGREEELLRIYESLDSIVSAPGEEFFYQELPYILLSGVIENVTGQKFEDWMSENMFKAAGLEHTVFYKIGADGPNVAHGYTPASIHSNKGAFRSRDGRWDEYDYGEVPFFLTRANKGIYTNGREFMKWVKALYEGKLISPETLDMTTTKHIDTERKYVGFGMGVFVEEKPGMPKKFFRMMPNGGFTVFEGGFPSQNLFYLIFSNRNDWNRLETARKIDSVFVAEGWLPVTEH